VDIKYAFAELGSPPRADPPREECVQRAIHVSLFEAAFGCIKRVSGMQPESCPRCGGSGESSAAWTLGSKCMQCFGRSTACVACLGSGVYKPPPPQCPGCKGSGKSERRAWLVDLPIYAGTLDGTIVQNCDIRVRAGAEALPRTLQFTVRIDLHPLFKLNHNRLSVLVPVSVWRWAMGGALTVPTLDGSARIGLPAKPGVLQVRDQGWPAYKRPQQRDALYVLPKIVYPEQLDRLDMQALEQLEARSHLPDVLGWQRSLQAWAASCPQGPGA
jgi:molecular chaperone DnaJ